MKNRKSISLLTAIIAVLSLIAAVCGIIPGQGPGYEYKSIHGQIISIYGKGLYQNDSSAVAIQAIGQDAVTILFGIPLLIVSLYFARKGHIKGRLLLTGALGYFLYTYASYSFLSMYNPLFLVYVALMSLSLFAFVLSIISFDMENLHLYFSGRLPVKVIGGFLISIACLLGLMWLKAILTPLLRGAAPEALEHYTTLTIQALDLAFVVPTAILSGILLIRKKSFGYLLATVMTVKETALLAAITSMIIAQAISGVHIEPVQVLLFLLFDMVIAACLVLIMRNIKEPRRID